MSALCRFAFSSSPFRGEIPRSPTPQLSASVLPLWETSALRLPPEDRCLPLKNSGMPAWASWYFSFSSQSWSFTCFEGIGFFFIIWLFQKFCLRVLGPVAYPFCNSRFDGQLALQSPPDQVSSTLEMFEGFSVELACAPISTAPSAV